MASFSNIKNQVSEGSASDKINVGGSTFTKGQVRDAINFGSRVARGKPTAGVRGKQSFDKLRSVLPGFKREVAKGTAIRLGKKVPFVTDKERFSSSSRRGTKRDSLGDKRSHLPTRPTETINVISPPKNLSIPSPSKSMINLSTFGRPTSRTTAVKARKKKRISKQTKKKRRRFLI